MLKVLVKTYFKGNGGLSILQAFKAKSRSKAAIGFSYFGIFMLALLYMWCIYSSLVSAFTLSVSYAIGVFFAIAISLTVFFTLTSVDNVLVTGKDLNTLKVLPIPSSVLMRSRFAILYAEAFIETLLAYIPFLLASLFSISFSFAFLLLGLLAVFVIPAFSILLMGLLSYLAVKHLWVKRCKDVLLWVMMFLIIGAYLKVLGKQSSGQNLILFLEVKRGVGQSDILLFLCTLLALFISSVILYFCCIRIAKSIKDVEVRVKTKRMKGAVCYKAHSPVYALFQREFRIMMSSSGIYTELILELLMPFVLILIYSFMGVMGKMVALLEFEFVRVNLHLLLSALLIFFLSISMLSSTSVSREGKEFSLAKVFPVSAEERVRAKILFHTALMAPAIVVFLLMIFFISSATVLDLFLLLIFFLSFMFLISVLGLYVDYSNPHTVWERPQEAVKQNTNGLISWAYSLLFLFVCVSVYVLLYYFTGEMSWTLLAPIALSIAVVLPLYKALLKKVERIYR